MALKPYLQLTRPANLVTAVTDILAGLVIAQFSFAENFAYWLIPATIGLYGGGVVLNDYFDAALDAVERPERPIPSGKVPVSYALLFGLLLLFSGVLFASFVSTLSAGIAVGIAVMTIVYNRFAKHNRLLGPLTMGLCRGGNLLLGVSVTPEILNYWWPVAIVPVVYIAAITLISQDEVHGGKLTTLYLAGGLYISVHLIQLVVAFRQGNVLLAGGLILIHAIMVGRPLLRAMRNPVGPMIGKAVKAGVISLIIMNAAWCMVFGYWPIAILTLLLLPLSMFLGKLFAVT